MSTSVPLALRVRVSVDRVQFVVDLHLRSDLVAGAAAASVFLGVGLELEHLNAVFRDRLMLPSGVVSAGDMLGDVVPSVAVCSVFAIRLAFASSASSWSGSVPSHGRI